MLKPTSAIERSELQRVANMLPESGILDGVNWECDFAMLVRRILFELDNAEERILQVKKMLE